LEIYLWTGGLLRGQIRDQKGVSNVCGMEIFPQWSRKPCI